jgi:hypothetical protein
MAELALRWGKRTKQKACPHMPEIWPSVATENRKPLRRFGRPVYASRFK